LQTEFIGEQLLPGKLGHLFVIISFIGSLLSAFAYLQSTRFEKNNELLSSKWLLIARNSFIIHTAAIIAIFFTLYYIITNHLFEYHYAWAHSDKSLNTKYLLSCFWEGQQGSFLLWSFWHGILGLVVLFKGKALESRAMTIISVVQACLATTILGFYLPGDIQLGTSPFLLLREQMQNAPIFQQANYLSMVTDGNGLNVLLQNYWMVIHPPILFLGFASTLIPFSFAIAAMWKGDYQEWIKPTLRWSLFSGGILGLGIMMGGAWAYESLNFGGFWAWDPVENASLVPWMLMVAAIHTLVIYRATGRSLMVTFVFYSLCYLGIWYSTFLTRTGVLGNTSVHAFTGEGKSLFWQLLVFIAIIVTIGFGLIIYRRKTMPLIKTEEALWTREFWMFIGSFILLLSAIQISISTSIPVWSPLAKWITGKDVAPPVEPVAHYNNIQIWVVMIITLISATALFLKYKKTDLKTLIKKFSIVISLSILVSIIVGLTQKINGWQFITLLFCASFSIVASAYYAIMEQKSIKKMGPALSHFGFGVLILGVLITGHKKEVISLNTLGGLLPLGIEDMREAVKASQENVMLYQDVPVAMNDYWATFKGDSTSADDPRTFYKVLFERKDSVSQKVLESFTLYPDAFVNPKGQTGLSANPSSKHYWNKDIFTYISSTSGKSAETPTTIANTDTFKSFKLAKGDTIYLSKGFIIFQGFNTEIKNDQYVSQQNDIAVSAALDIFTLEGKINSVYPVYYIRNQVANFIDDTTAASIGAIVRLGGIITEENKADIQIKEIEQTKNWIVLKAILFPHINLVWLGTILMVIGFFLSMWRNANKKKAQTPNLSV
jgi:cytochrome c-type biogenesis protein CcmF